MLQNIFLFPIEMGRKEGVNMCYAKNLTSMEEVLALKESKNYLAVEGIIENLKEKVAKNGESYVCGTLCCRDLRLPFKKWSETLQSLTLPQSKVVQLFGNAQYFNKEVQFVVNSFGESKTDPKLYVNNALFDPRDMQQAILQNLKELANRGRQTNKESTPEDDILFVVELAYQMHSIVENRFKDATNPVLYYPYGESIHSERSGLLYHIYNVIGSLNEIGLPKVRTADGGYTCAIDLFVVKAAIATYRLYIIDYFTVDEETGAILDTDTLRMALEGKSHIMDLLRFGEEQAKIRAYPPIYLNFKHCVLALNGLVPPATPEAILACNRVKAELDLALSMSSGKVKASDIQPVDRETNGIPYIGALYLD